MPNTADKKMLLYAFLRADSPEALPQYSQRLARQLNQFVETDARRKTVARPGGWVETDIARRMLLVIAKTIELSSIGLIYSDAGRGKSLTLQAAAAIFPGSILVRIVSGATSPYGVASLLHSAAGVKGGKTCAMQQLVLRLIDHLRDSGRAILIDEAHRLKPEALEVIRDVHDECGIPFILAGTHRVNEMCSDVDLFFGQFTSRIALRYDVTEPARQSSNGSPCPSTTARHPLHSVDEIRRMYESDKVRFTADGLDFLTSMANTLGLGGLRLCTKLVMVAVQVAAAECATAIDAKLIRRVMRRLHGSDYTGHQIERVMKADPAKVAVA